MKSMSSLSWNQMNKILVHLGQNKDYTLTVELFDNRVANRVWHIIKENPDLEFISRTQFYEFGETQEEVEAKLQEAIQHLIRLKPDSFNEKDCLNRLHENFPDLLPHETDEETRHWLSMFNYHLHHLERKTNRFTLKRQFLFSTRSPSEALHELDYDLFTPSRTENTVYMNYPHVGKNIMEIVGDADVDVPIDHIVPTSILKPDLLFHIDPPVWVNKESQVVDYINKWLPKIEHKLPYPIGDKRLAIGNIPLGRIINPNINKIKENQYLYGIEAV